MQKPWYKSRGVVGGVVCILAGILQVAGVEVRQEEQDLFVELCLALASAVGGVVAVVGRYKAKG